MIAQTNVSIKRFLTMFVINIVQYESTGIGNLNGFSDKHWLNQHYVSYDTQFIKKLIIATYNLLSYDAAVFQWITSCHKNRMTTRVITLLREYITTLTTSVTTM